MSKIGLFYGSDTGYTEGVAGKIKELFGEENVEVMDIYKAKPEDFGNYEKIIIGLSTWHDGQLQTDWDNFFEDFKTINFENKKVAIFGLGDQIGYAEYFVDGIGILGEVVVNNGGEIIGVTSTEGYDFESSLAEFDDGYLMGLAIDEDNQPEMTDDRVDAWVKQVQGEFSE